jgi:hypothetical protein
LRTAFFSRIDRRYPEVVEFVERTLEEKKATEEKLTELADSAIKGALAHHGTGTDRVFGLESRTQTIPFAAIVEFTADFSADLLSTVSVRREVGN